MSEASDSLTDWLCFVYWSDRIKKLGIVKNWTELTVFDKPVSVWQSDSPRLLRSDSLIFYSGSSERLPRSTLVGVKHSDSIAVLHFNTPLVWESFSKSDIRTVWQFDSLTVRQWASVTVWQYDSQRVWQSVSVTVCQCDSVTVWKWARVTVWQFDSVTVGQFDSDAVWNCDSVTVSQSEAEIPCERASNALRKVFVHPESFWD